MQYWLFKSEPDAFSWEKLKSKGKAGQEWDGVRNYAARNNMRAMKIGDLGFFYHSNEGLDVVGIVEVCKLAHRDSTTDDERWECVDIRAVKDVPTPPTLNEIKANPEACGNGAGQARPAVGAAGDGSRMEGSLPHGRAQPGALNEGDGRKDKADFGQRRGVHSRQHDTHGAAACSRNLAAPRRRGARIVAENRRRACGDRPAPAFLGLRLGRWPRAGAPRA